MSAADDNPGVIAPPPLLYGGALAAGIALDLLVLQLETGLSAAWRYGLAGLLLVPAIALLAGALGGFRRAGTKAEPWQPATAIVTDGVYGLTRNPMYVAMAAVYAAVALAADSVVALVLLVPLMIVVQYGVVVREERYLEAKFGDRYRRYTRAVRRWI